VSAPLDHDAARPSRVITTAVRLAAAEYIFPQHGYQPLAALLASDSPVEPLTYKAAIGSPDAVDRLAAIQSEYDSLIGRNTWDLVCLPAGRRTVRRKWVFTTKRNADGSIARYKARLCGKGFSQVHGLDFAETFDPTVKFTTLRIIFSLVAHLRVHCEQTDVDCAFLSADMDEEIYMDEVEGFCQRGENGAPLVCLLKKSLY
jgi:hypothetical protein